MSTKDTGNNKPDLPAPRASRHAQSKNVRSEQIQVSEAKGYLIAYLCKEFTAENYRDQVSWKAMSSFFTCSTVIEPL